MANQITVTSGTGNIQVTTSRAVIGVSNVANANVANYAANVTGNAQPNITSLGTLTGLTSSGNITAPFFIGNVVGNISGNLVVPGSNTSVLFNQLGNAGASDALKFDYSANVLTVDGNANVTGKLTLGGNIQGNLLPQANGTQDIGSNTQRWNDLYLNGNTIYLGSQTLESNATHTIISGVLSADGSGLSNITAANATFANSAGVANTANIANSVDGVNVSGQVSFAATANSVAVGNVTGLGNIATVNLNGNALSLLDGTGNWTNIPSTANANYANYAGNAFSVSGANVTGTVANATYATSAGTANSATVAASANSVAGANVSGTVANATFATSAGSANTANTANTAGTVTTNAQPNITSVGTLTNLAVTGNITANTVTANYLVGNVSLTNIDSLYFDTAAGVTPANVGQVAWDDGDGTLQLLMKGANVVQQIGTQQYARVYNAEATTLNKGEVVYVFGAQGNRLSVKRAQANAEATSFGTVGFVAESIASGSEGFIITSGALYKLNTNGLTAGNAVYLSPSVAGGYTTTKPVAPNQLVVLGWIERVSTTVGSIYVKVDNGYELDELHDVLITSPTAGQALVYNASNLWVNGNPNVANSALSVAGANVSGTVANANYASYANVANSANSVAVANVSGIGNIATVNLDGNAGNILYGNGAFAALPNVANVANANYANFAGDVVNATQSNITSVGNLVSLTINNGVANTPTYQFNGNGVALPNGAGNVDALTSVGSMSLVEGKLGTNYDVNNGFNSDIIYYVNDGANTAQGIKLSAGAYGDSNTALVPSTFFISAPEPTSDLANASTSTVSSMQIGQGGLTVVTGSQINSPSMGVFVYGNTTQNQASGLRFNRRRGNADVRSNVAGSDYLGNIEWRGGGTGTGSLNSRIATFGAKVDSSYGGPGNVMPIGFEMDVVTSSNTFIAHNFYANGTVALGGNITANNLGNIVSVNLDGNASNILYGNGVFATAPSVSNVANANYANFAGDVVNSSQANITSLGNLTTLQIGNGSANTATTTFTPVGANITTLSGDIFVNNKRVSYDDVNQLANGVSTQDAIIMPNDTGNGISQNYVVNYLVQDLANISNIATMGTETVGITTSYTAGDMAAPSQRIYSLYGADSDLANANPNTALDITLGGSGLFINTKMPNQNAGPAQSGVVSILHYGEVSDPSSATVMSFQRRRGNNSGGSSTRLPVQANDYLGNIVWRGAGSATGSINSQRATIGARVDSSYGGPGNIMPIGMTMTVVNSSNSQVTHNFYSNGNVNFSGAITATNIGNVANTNFNGNGSTVLFGNGVFGSAPTPTSIQNGNSVVNFTGSGGDLNINIDGRQYATFSYNRQLSLTGVEADYTNAARLLLDNGGMQIINEDLGGGLPSFEFKSYYNTGGTIAPYVFQRARGNLTNPANAQSGDAIMNQSFQAYSGSGFTGAGVFSATVSNNDNAGNITTNIELATANNTNGSRIILTSDIVDLYATSNVRTNANINVNSGAIVLNSNGLATANNFTATNYANANNITATNYANANNVTVTNTTTTKYIEQNLGNANLTPGGTLNLASNVEQYYKITLTTGSANSTSTINCANLDTAGMGKTYRFLVFNNSGGNQTVQTSGLAQYNPSGVIQNGKYSLVDVILHGTDGSAVFTLSNVA